MAREVGTAAGPVVDVSSIIAAIVGAALVLLVASLAPMMSSARVRLVDALRAE